MTFESFINFRDVVIKNPDHERVVRAFYPYLASVTGNARLLPDLVGCVLAMDTGLLTVDKGCFNEVPDGVVPPYDDVDFYIQLSNGVCIFIYGRVPMGALKPLEGDVYVGFLLSDGLGTNVERVGNYIYFR